MKPGSVKIIDRMSAIEAIKQLNEEDLRFLNHLIVERIHLLSQIKSSEQMARFTRGDRVGFRHSDGRVFEGIVMRLNKKTVSVVTNDGMQWNVAPSLLYLVKSVMG